MSDHKYVWRLRKIDYTVKTSMLICSCETNQMPCFIKFLTCNLLALNDRMECLPLLHNVPHSKKQKKTYVFFKNLHVEKFELVLSETHCLSEDDCDCNAMYWTKTKLFSIIWNLPEWQVSANIITRAPYHVSFLDSWKNWRGR